MSDDESNAAAAKAFERSDPNAAAILVRRGVEQERARVIAHLDFGDSCHAQAAALKAIRAGDPMTAEATTRYLLAAQNHADRYVRQRESDKVEGALARVGAGMGLEEEDLAGQVVRQLRSVRPDFVRE